MSKTPMQELIQFMWDNNMDLLLTSPFKEKINELIEKEKQAIEDAFRDGMKSIYADSEYADEDSKEYYKTKYT